MNERSDQPYLDEMDRLLINLPAEEIPPYLLPAILQAIEQRRRKGHLIRVGFGSSLAVIGAILVFPTLPGLLSAFSLPESGLVVAFGVLNQAVGGLGAWLNSLDHMVVDLQAGFYANLDFLAWIGLTCLASGCILVLGSLQIGRAHV